MTHVPGHLLKAASLDATECDRVVTTDAISATKIRKDATGALVDSGSGELAVKTYGVGDGVALYRDANGLQINGDRVKIDYTPTNYTRDISPAQAVSETDLTAHLAGLDTAVASAGGGVGIPDYLYKSRMTLREASGSVVSSANELVMRGFTRAGATDPVTFSDDAKLFSDSAALNKNIAPGSVNVDVGGYATAPTVSTMYRFFLIGKEDGTVGAIATPFTALSNVEDDLPQSQYIPAGYVYIRELGEFYNNAIGSVVGFYRTGDRVQYKSPLVVFTNTTVSTPAVALLPPDLPEGCTGLEVYAMATSNTSTDGAMAVSYDTSAWIQFQYENIGFAAYTEAPTGSQGSHPYMMVWNRGNVGIYIKSTKAGNASTTGQSLYINGYERPV